MTYNDFVQFASAQILSAAISRDVTIRSIADGDFGTHQLTNKTVIVAERLAKSLVEKGFLNGKPTST